MFRRAARHLSDVLLRLRTSIPGTVVWVDSLPYGLQRVVVDNLKVDPMALVVAHGEIKALRESLQLAARLPEDVLVGLEEYRLSGLPGAPFIERDSFGEGGKLDNPVSAETDRQDISLPPIFNRLLYFLVKEVRPALCLELGTAHGVSTLHLLAGLESGELYTIEADPVRRGQALRAFETLLPSARVTSLEGRFDECLPDLLRSLPGPIDLVFEDGPHNPDVTLDMFARVRDHIRPGGLYIVDDIYHERGNEKAWTAIRSHGSIAAWAEINTRLGVCVKT